MLGSKIVILVEGPQRFLALFLISKPYTENIM